MSIPLDQQAPPGFVLQQNANTPNSTHGSIGAVVAVLLVVIILGVVAVVIGRLCSGRSIMGYGHYDLETWAETKCSSCIDGRINPQIPRPRVSTTTTPEQQTHQESELQQQEQSPQTPQTSNV